MKRLLPLILLFTFSFFAKGANLKGYVNDAATGEPTVHLENSAYGAMVGLDGSYLIKGVPPGTYKIAAHR